MNLSEKVQNSLILGTNTSLISDTTFKSLLENCFNVLIGGEEIHNITSLYNSKPDLIKEYYASLLRLSIDFVRHNQSKDDVNKLLLELGYPNFRTNLFIDLYEKNRRDVEISLLNVGNHPPHITDVTWRLDHVIKTSNLDESGGPLFRISLKTEQIGNNHNDLNFTCDLQELQDLIYKLKDAVRHCQRIGSGLSADH